MLFVISYLERRWFKVSQSGGQKMRRQASWARVVAECFYRKLSYDRE